MIMKIQRRPIAVDSKRRWLYVALGAASIVGFSWFFIVTLREYLAYPEVPKPTTVKEAIGREDPGRGAWVKLTDLRLPCSIRGVTPARGRDTYHLGTGASGTERIVISAKRPLPCSEEPIELIGVLGSSAPGRIVGVDFPGVPWETWPSSYQITLSTIGGPENARIGLWLCPIMVLCGLGLVIFFLRAPTQFAPPAVVGAAADPLAEQGDELVEPWSPSDTVLPRRPLALAPQAVRDPWLVIVGTPVIIVGLVVVALWAIVPSVRAALDERAIWASGVPIQDFDAEVEEQTDRDVIRHLRLGVRFTYEGTPHNVTFTSSSLLTSPRPEGALEIRIDPRNPERVASSWTQAIHLGRVLMWALYSLIGVLGLLLISAPRNALRRLRATRAVALHRAEVLIPLVRWEPILNNGIDTGMRKYFCEHPVTGATIEFTERKRQPLIVGERLFAVHPEGEPAALTIVYERFYPFELSEGERRAAEGALVRFAR
jgi:hypothetical protein